MPRQPLSHERILEVLESCRAGSSDLDNPEFADVAEQIAKNPELEEIYEQIQNADLKISAAFHDVEIPAGLEQRLVAALHLAQAEDVVALALQGDAETVPFTASLVSSSSETLSPQKNRAISRRWLLTAGGLLTSAVAIFLVFFFRMNNTAEYSEQTVLEEAIRFFNNDSTTTQGHLLAETSPPKEFAFSKALLQRPGIRWREVKNFLGSPAVAFDLPARGGARTTLYAVHRSFDGLADLPSMKPFTTGGCCTAAWQEDHLVYVLVVQGSQNTYQQYLIPSGPMA
jgi:hypothetical protein